MERSVTWRRPACVTWRTRDRSSRIRLLRIYSMTKPITSVAAMTLFEQGEFKLDDPVSKFIPEFEKTTVLVEDGDSTKAVPARRQITIRDVFRHTTGFNYAGGEAREYYEREGMVLATAARNAAPRHDDRRGRDGPCTNSRRASSRRTVHLQLQHRSLGTPDRGLVGQAARRVLAADDLRAAGNGRHGVLHTAGEAGSLRLVPYITRRQTGRRRQGSRQPRSTTALRSFPAAAD